jgi:hypothetical protein
MSYRFREAKYRQVATYKGQRFLRDAWKMIQSLQPCWQQKRNRSAEDVARSIPVRPKMFNFYEKRWKGVGKKEKMSH